MLVGKTIDFTDSIFISIAGIFVVMLELAIIAILIVMLSKIINILLDNKNNSNQAPAENAVKSENQVVAQPIQQTQLINIDDKTAAVVMAIVSHETGISLDKLSFKSIKEI